MEKVKKIHEYTHLEKKALGAGNIMALYDAEIVEAYGVEFFNWHVKTLSYARERISIAFSCLMTEIIFELPEPIRSAFLFELR